MSLPEQKQRLLSRRDFLTLGLVVTVGVIYGKKAFDKLWPRYFPSSPEAQNLEPSFSLIGAIAVSEGVNIRTTPAIPNRTRFRKPDNTIKWEEIETINGVPLNDAKAFVIVNTPLVIGQDVNLDSFGGEDLWIKINVKKKGDQQEKPNYINYSSQTRQFVKPLESTELATRIGDVIYKYEDEFLVSSKLGQIFIPQNPETVAREIMPDLWAERMIPKLEGRAPLRKYQGMDGIIEERIVKNVQVVAAGDNWKEKLKMEQENTPVNVRDYPAKLYYNGEPTRILGVIPQGTRIKRVLFSPFLASWFAAFAFSDVEGSIFNSKGNRVELPPNKICTIWKYYLA